MFCPSGLSEDTAGAVAAPFGVPQCARFAGLMPVPTDPATDRCRIPVTKAVFLRKVSHFSTVSRPQQQQVAQILVFRRDRRPQTHNFA